MNYGIIIDDTTDTYFILHQTHVVYNYSNDEKGKEEVIKLLIGENELNQNILKDIIKNWS